MPAIIVENDESPWEDVTGALYHFPQRYLGILQPGEKVIYYKGRQLDPIFSSQRLSPNPHYFGIARIAKVYPDPNSQKRDHFATIEDYRRFAEALNPRRPDGSSFEIVPESRASNYWRDGVRAISEEVYDAIVAQARLVDAQPPDTAFARDWPTRELESAQEGAPHLLLTTVFERDPALRAQALAIHGLSCVVCGFDFAIAYGPHGKGYIHIHHLKPLHSFAEPMHVDPEADLVPVCPNCHSMIHRRREHTLSIQEVKDMVRGAAG